MEFFIGATVVAIVWFWFSYAIASDKKREKEAVSLLMYILTLFKSSNNYEDLKNYISKNSRIINATDGNFSWHERSLPGLLFQAQKNNGEAYRLGIHGEGFPKEYAYQGFMLVIDNPNGEWGIFLCDSFATVKTIRAVRFAKALKRVLQEANLKVFYHKEGV
jgi:hypothetical protein